MPVVEPTPLEQEVKRVAAALRTAIRLSGVSHRHIERTLNISTGYLTRILAGQVELRVSHVLSVCGVIGLPAGNFFAALFPPRPEATAETMSRGLSQLYPGPARGRNLPSLLRELRGTVDQLEALLASGNEPA
ncbi:MAG TPA: hypothetical protein VEW48_25505 [Thermoanaerobaculia bacterium]|nr:hypothetical protein [Thermoanaerobaculia bacterium]